MMAATFLLQVNRGFRTCPMQAKPNETGMLSVKKKHPLGVISTCAGANTAGALRVFWRLMYKPATPVERGQVLLPWIPLLITHAAGNARPYSPRLPLPMTTT
jgi:hypothetical protein